MRKLSLGKTGPLHSLGPAPGRSYYKCILQGHITNAECSDEVRRGFGWVRCLRW